MGLVLFSGDEATKPLGALSGGEASRLNFCRLSLEKPNVLVLDEPTNHLDLEAIEALVDGLEAFDGTLVFVSHDRWFVGQLADRIIEITPDGLSDYRGTYEEYVHSLRDDHLDADAVLERERRKTRGKRQEGKRQEGESPNTPGGGAVDGLALDPELPTNPYRLREQRDEIEARIAEIEARLESIEAAFADPDLYGGDRVDEVQSLGQERESLQAELEGLMTRWEAVERQLEAVE
jgi:ABC-type multidrug transport system ATPase subunit